MAPLSLSVKLRVDTAHARIFEAYPKNTKNNLNDSYFSQVKYRKAHPRK